MFYNTPSTNFDFDKQESFVYYNIINTKKKCNRVSSKSKTKVYSYIKSISGKYGDLLDICISFLKLMSQFLYDFSFIN